MTQKQATSARVVVTSAQIQSCQRIMFMFELPNRTFIPQEMRVLRPAKVLPKNPGQLGERLLPWENNVAVDIAGIVERLLLDNRTSFTYARIRTEDNSQAGQGAVKLRISLKREADDREDANYTGFEAQGLVRDLRNLQGKVSIHLNSDPQPRGEHTKMLNVNVRVERYSTEPTDRYLRIDAENGPMVIR